MLLVNGSVSNMDASVDVFMNQILCWVIKFQLKWQHSYLVTYLFY